MKYKIFVSGVQDELKHERYAIKKLIEEFSLLDEYFNVFLFEDLSAKSISAENIYLGEVARCDIYVGILGYDYGKIGDDGISATEREFNEAKKSSKEILIFVKRKEHSRRHLKLENLIDKIENPKAGYVYKPFSAIQDLKNAVHESLIGFLRVKGIVGKKPFDSAVCDEAKFEDIDETKIRWFLQRARKQRNLALDLHMPAADVLAHLNLSTTEGTLKNSALLLFGKDPHKFFLQGTIKCMQFTGTTVEKPFPSYHVYSGNLFEQIDKSLAFVLDTIRLPVIQQTGTASVARAFEIPEFVIQEAIMNAVAHRDYNSTASTQVMVFVDRIEIWNPGRLPPEITVESLKEPHSSYPNNPLLAEVLYLADYIQEVGSGTLEMIKQSRALGNPEPEFVQRKHEFRVIIPRDVLTEDVLLWLDLNERQMKAVEYVKIKGKITNAEYRRLTEVIDRTALRDLNGLCKKGVLKRIGATGRGAEYILTRQKPDKSDINQTKTRQTKNTNLKNDSGQK